MKLKISIAIIAIFATLGLSGILSSLFIKKQIVETSIALVDTIVEKTEDTKAANFIHKYVPMSDAVTVSSLKRPLDTALMDINILIVISILVYVGILVALVFIYRAYGRYASELHEVYSPIKTNSDEN